jgi:hypothetical protein
MSLTQICILSLCLVITSTFKLQVIGLEGDLLRVLRIISEVKLLDEEWLRLSDS